MGGLSLLDVSGRVSVCVSFSYSTHVFIELDKECPLSASQVPLGAVLPSFHPPYDYPYFTYKEGGLSAPGHRQCPPGFKPKCPPRRGSGSSQDNTQGPYGSNWALLK